MRFIKKEAVPLDLRVQPDQEPDEESCTDDKEDYDVDTVIPILQCEVLYGDGTDCESEFDRLFHKCPICHQEYSLRSTFKRHLLTHTGEKPHTCSVCGKEFSQRSTLQQHMTLHTGQTPHVCIVCGAGFSRKSSLEAHFISHTGLKPHHCHLCGKGFTQKCSINRHMLTHTKQKPHMCSICGKCFTQRSSMLTHMMTHSNDKPYKCPCGRSFPRRCDLDRHLIGHQLQLNNPAGS